VVHVRDKLTNYIERKCPHINARRAVLAAIANEAEEEGTLTRRFVPQRRR
jgi:hypothetical protein